MATSIGTKQLCESLEGAPEAILYCANELCGAGPWSVQLLSADRSLWRVSSETEGGAFIVAGSVSVCPFCGTNLSGAENYVE